GLRVAGPIVLARLQNIAFTLERVGQAQSAVWTLTQIAVLDRGTFFGFDLEQRGGTRLSRSAVAERIVRRASNAIFWNGPARAAFGTARNADLTLFARLVRQPISVLADQARDGDDPGALDLALLFARRPGRVRLGNVVVGLRSPTHIQA